MFARKLIKMNALLIEAMVGILTSAFKIIMQN
jgi:hypothetical protein